MSKRKRLGIVEFLEIFGSAISAAAAVDHRRQPSDRDLRVLGIEPAQFRAIKRF